MATGLSGLRAGGISHAYGGNETGVHVKRIHMLYPGAVDDMRGKI